MKNSLCMAVVLSAYSLLGCASSSNEAGGPHQHGHEHGDHECEACKKLPAGEKCEHCKKKEAMEHAQHEHKGEGDHKKHPPMSPAVHAFHEALSPVYHAEKNAARNDQACAAAASFKEKAGPIATEAGENAAKKTASANLATSIGDLEKACAAAGKPEVEAKLEKLHDAFHAAMEAK
ncbi:MAG: hypothetical protein IPG04_04395 [Polyangiaceae bacterium]|nr:hypothetical protein [Polyangiaceae bacterium]